MDEKTKGVDIIEELNIEIEQLNKTLVILKKDGRMVREETLDDVRYAIMYRKFTILITKGQEEKKGGGRTGVK